MLNFQKSTALKAANFPQPAPENGQFWYLSDVLVVVVGGDRLRGLESGNAYSDGFAVLREHLTFAPTASDILAVIDFDWTALRRIQGGEWEFSAPGDLIDEEFISHNPAEACAAAYLSIFSVS